MFRIAREKARSLAIDLRGMSILAECVLVGGF